MVGAEEQKPIQVKVVVVTMFEIGEATGDRPGEFRTWVEQLPLMEKMPFPQGFATTPTKASSASSPALAQRAPQRRS